MKKFVVLLAALAGVFVLTGCADSPKEVSKKWMKALVAQDLKTANEYSTEKVHVLNAFIVESIKKEKSGKTKDGIEQSLKDIDSCKVTIDGDKAVIAKEGSSNDSFKLKKVDGDWKVDVEK